MNDEKFKRIKYIRALEKFSLNVLKSLKKTDFDIEKFKNLLEKNSKILEKIEPVFLDDPYTKALESFVNIALNSNDKDSLLKSANALDKFKKAQKYKRQKHKGNFSDEY